MSIHAIEERHRSGDRPGAMLIYWAECACGWTGPEREQQGNYGIYKAVRRDYLVHVEQALGADAYYNAGVRCCNCGSHHEQPIVVGTRVREGRCQRCGVENLIPDNEAYESEEDRMKQWRS